MTEYVEFNSNNTRKSKFVHKRYYGDSCGDMCDEEPHYVCTRLPGHSGRHEAGEGADENGKTSIIAWWE